MICRNCKKEYEPQYLELMGVRILKGQGYCPECARVVCEGEEAKEKVAREAAIATTRREWRQSCGIPPKFMFEEFATFCAEGDRLAFSNAHKRCLDYASKFSLDKKYPSMLLYSDHSWGVGKTHLAASIAHTILNKWNGKPMACPVRFISEPDLFLRIQATYNYTPEEKPYRESESDIIKSLIGVRLLILDDVGKRKVQDLRFVQRVMFSIIDGRYKAMRPVVITANLDPERLKQYLGAGQGDEATFDRIWEMVKGKVIKMDGQSYRRRK